MNRLFLMSVLLAASTLHAQKKEEGFDASFKPTSNMPRYYVSTELKDGRWYRVGWYLPEKTMAMYGWYKDRECQTPDGEMAWFYLNKQLKSAGKYVNGLQEGSWVSFHENGMMRDSFVYEAGIRKGIGLGWDKEGYLTDSLNLDQHGNGVEVNWYAGGDGVVSMIGYRKHDTIQVRKWQYYHRNRKLKAVLTFDDNKEIARQCYDENGNELDSKDCEDREANFKGKDEEWMRFLAKNLNGDVPVKKGAPVGIYTVMVQFVVSTDGGLQDIQPLTKFGFGMEEEVVRLLKRSPKWIPAKQFGRLVLAYRRQPISFSVVQQ